MTDRWTPEYKQDMWDRREEGIQKCERVIEMLSPKVPEDFSALSLEQLRNLHRNVVSLLNYCLGTEGGLYVFDTKEHEERIEAFNEKRDRVHSLMDAIHAEAKEIDAFHLLDEDFREMVKNWSEWEITEPFEAWKSKVFRMEDQTDR